MVEITPLVACGNREVLYTVRVHPYNVGKRAVGWESSVNNLLITEMVMGIKTQKTRLTPGRTASLVNFFVGSYRFLHSLKGSVSLTRMGSRRTEKENCFSLNWR